MSNAATPNRWFQAWRADRRPLEADPADMGTAFGLDASFDADHGRAPQIAPAEARQGWFKRLAGRGRRPASA
ncbi:hypothetical protein [Rubrivivax sp. A210]|uniref:hypothetical protein n=1 Tax=Rubrivivax sp. A210 TaxID=2772301 RepID=UPI001919AD4B|nr:hypothetical protein [Rubrivivax sp. A210]